MARLCERPGCARAGEVRYGVEHEHLLVWLEANERVEEGRGGMLCRRHADTMVVPVGWTLDDRREPVPRLFRAPEPTAVPPSDPVRRQRAKAAATVEQLDLTSELARPTEAAATDTDADTDTDTDTESADDTGWMPVFDQQDDLDGLLRPATPLLARAFQQRDRRRDG